MNRLWVFVILFVCLLQSGCIGTICTIAAVRKAQKARLEKANADSVQTTPPPAAPGG